MSIADGGGGLLGWFGGFLGGGGGGERVDTSNFPVTQYVDTSFGRIPTFYGGGVLPPPTTPDVVAATPVNTIPNSDYIPGRPEGAPPGSRIPGPGPGEYPVPYQRPPTGGTGGRLPTLVEVAPLLGRIGLGIWSTLIPTDLGDATVLKGKKKGARKRPRPKFPGKAPKIPRSFTYANLPMPSLPAGGAPGTKSTGNPAARTSARRVPAAAKRPGVAKVPRGRLGIPTSFPYSLPIPSLPPGTKTGGGLGSVLLGLPKRLGIGWQDLLPIGISLLSRPRTSQPRTPPQGSFASPGPSSPVSPLTPTYTDPLTPVLTAGAPYPFPGSGYGGTPTRPMTLTDQCRALNRRRKPKRRCVKRDDCNKCIQYEAL